MTFSIQRFNPASRRKPIIGCRSSMFLTLGIVILTSCSQFQTPDSREADARTLREGEIGAFVKDWGGKDVDRIAAHYTKDGNVMIPNTPMMTSKDVIAKTMRDAFADPNWSLTLQPVQVEVSKSRDLGYTRGTYVLTATDPPTNKVAKEKGRFVTIFKKEVDGSRKAIQQTSSAEAPATLE